MIMKTRIINKLVEDQDFTTKEINYIQSKLLPNFECDCDICRFNLMLHFDLVAIQKNLH